MAKKSKLAQFTPRDKPRKRPGRHSKSPNKAKKRGHNKKYNRQGRGWQISLNILYRKKRKEYMKTVTLNVEGASQGQWSTFLLELNLMKKAWRSYGVKVDLKAHSINKIIALGTSHGEINKKLRRDTK